mmetsp:Transcript_24229/g.50823  ORF Transcript_24229/g.50823 Transcript_24229/m.50823 type:complete len:584 (-) Transcript_24229:392-2143(-)
MTSAYLTRSSIPPTVIVFTAVTLWVGTTWLAYHQGRRRGWLDRLANEKVEDGTVTEGVSEVVSDADNTRVIDSHGEKVKSQNNESKIEAKMQLVSTSRSNNSVGERRKTAQNGKSKIQPQNEQLSSLPIYPIATLTSIYRLCVGTPRQGMLAPHSRGIVTFHENKLSRDSVLELKNYSHVYVMFVFHLNSNFGVWKDTFGNIDVSESSEHDTENFNADNSKNNKKKAGKRQFPSKISPPSLGGKKVGVFSTRTPHRPNPIGFSLCRLDAVIDHSDNDNGEKLNSKKESKKSSKTNKKSNVGANGTFSLLLSGLDIVDGTPILDIKPYVPHYDCVGYPFRDQGETYLTSLANKNERGESSSVQAPVSSSLDPTTSKNLTSCVRVPHWVDSGLQKRRTVTFLPEAEQFFHNLLTASSDTPHNSSETSVNKLQFYGPHSPWKDSPTEAVQCIKQCINELLGVDVRSAWQTKKARKGKFHAERSRRVKGWKGNVGSTGNVPSVVDDRGNKGVEGSASDGAEKDNTIAEGICTQQIDNLLVQFTIEAPREEFNVDGHESESRILDEQSKGSGAEDFVVVHSIWFIDNS